MSAVAPHPHRPPQPQQQAQPRKPIQSPYNPSSRELHGGPKNRLFLSLRSGLPAEVDWALPRLVLASFDHPEHFKLDQWVDSVRALTSYPTQWLDHLEQLQTSSHLLPPPPDLESRATNSLLVLRNASFLHNNAQLIARSTPFVALLGRFFALPLPSLLDLSLRSPEPLSHILVILQSIFPHLASNPSPSILQLFSSTLPLLLVETRDMALTLLLLPLLISGLKIPTLPAMPPTLLPHLLHTLTLSPPPLLNLTLDLLLSLLAPLPSASAAPTAPPYARHLLAMPTFPAHLRMLVQMLEHGAQRAQANLQVPRDGQSVLVRNPASTTVMAEEASRRRGEEREQNGQVIMRGGELRVDVGDKPPYIAGSIRERLYRMPEPTRSIAWMHETFVYSTTSQLLQVAFWHAYRDFFQHPSTKEQLLSASEVIKNVTVAFPGAAARVWTDERGEQKFVIANMGFRKGSDEDDRFRCHWRSCPTPTASHNPAQLLDHLRSTHLSDMAQTCQWAKCQHSPLTLTHLLTHLPALARPKIPDTIALHPTHPSARTGLPPTSLTHYPPAQLSHAFKLYFTGQITPLDPSKTPVGTALLAALVVRNLARALRGELASEVDELSRQARDDKRRKAEEGRFGLPIPDSVLREEEEEERRNADVEGEEGGLSRAERERAKAAFESVELRIGEVVGSNLAGLGGFLGEAFGW